MRKWTLDEIHADGSRTVRVKRSCNGCGRLVGDVTAAELDAGMCGFPLPDVTDECGCFGELFRDSRRTGSEGDAGKVVENHSYKRWRDNIPPCEFHPDLQVHEYLAIGAINDALMEEFFGNIDSMNDSALVAASYIIVWRKSLDDQGTKEPDYPDRFSDRALLRYAVHHILYAEDGTEPLSLRFAESALRTLWRRHHKDGPWQDVTDARTVEGKSFGTSNKSGVGSDVPIPVVKAGGPEVEDVVVPVVEDVEVRWVDSLPPCEPSELACEPSEPIDWAGHGFWALANLNDALLLMVGGEKPARVYEFVAAAASHVVGWRRGLEDQGQSKPDLPDEYSDFIVLRNVMHCVLWAHEWPEDHARLRDAEAGLRTLWRRNNPARTTTPAN